MVVPQGTVESAEQVFGAAGSRTLQQKTVASPNDGFAGPQRSDGSESHG